VRWGWWFLPLPAPQLTFDLAVVEGTGALPLGAQPPAAGEAERAAQVRLVHAMRTRLAGLEAVAGEVARGTLAWGRGGQGVTEQTQEGDGFPRGGSRPHGSSHRWDAGRCQAVCLD